MLLWNSITDSKNYTFLGDGTEVLDAEYETKIGLHKEPNFYCFWLYIRPYFCHGHDQLLANWGNHLLGRG